MKRSLAARIAVAACLAALAPAVGPAQSGRGRHQRIFAVPAPAKVAIDGRLDDWDLSGQLLMYVIKETSEMQSARFALMYDAEALYLGAAVRDPSPMMNRHDPRVDGHKGWDADACQFRIVLDPKQGYPVNQSSFNRDKNGQMAHLILWYYTDRKEPNLQMHFGMDYALPKAGYAPHGVVPRDKFQARYRQAADGRGYTFEYRIPWATLEARRPPAAGDVRVLVSRRADGKTAAIVFRPRVAGFAGKPIVFKSPTGTEAFDAIEATDRVGLDHRTERGRPGSFSATVTIPLDLLGLKLTPGGSLRMDVGYVFGNRTGTAAAVRAYWANNSFTANVVNDVPHESRLEPAEWGTAVVE